MGHVIYIIILNKCSKVLFVRLRDSEGMVVLATDIDDRLFPSEMHWRPYGKFWSEIGVMCGNWGIWSNSLYAGWRGFRGALFDASFAEIG